MKLLYSILFICFSLIVNGQIDVSSVKKSSYYFSFGAIYLSNNLNFYNDSNIVNDNGWNYEVFPKYGVGFFLAMDFKKILVNDVKSTNSFGLHLNIQYNQINTKSYIKGFYYGTFPDQINGNIWSHINSLQTNIGLYNNSILYKVEIENEISISNNSYFYNILTTPDFLNKHYKTNTFVKLINLSSSYRLTLSSHSWCVKPFFSFVLFTLFKNHGEINSSPLNYHPAYFDEIKLGFIWKIN